MRYLITGATGFIGRHLARHLLERGHHVTALVRRDGRVFGSLTVRGDLVTGEGLAAAVRGVDRVIHLAGVTKAADPRLYTMVNTVGTERLLAAVAARPEPPRLVYCSSLAAVGPGRRRHEDDPPAPVSAYGRSKLGGELALRGGAGRVPAVVVRPPIVYGPGDREFLPRLATAVRAGLLPAVGRPGPRHYSLLHVEDLCRALLTAADSGVPGATYHVSDGVEHLWDDVGATAAEVLGRRPPRVVHIPLRLALTVARTLGGASVLNPGKVAEAAHPAWTSAVGRLPFSPCVPLSEGLRTALTP
ncbi:NAD-dependent epimerase/dehydratase family protein [Streptomyces syringium]|uniref:NAD-dependent epimerase/dehydratase family protein n=1 Tax=Streptomyces syringium TaxID=76729 RepID=UPI00367C4987